MNIINRYPRLLIIGNTFDEYTGGGITLTNLFGDWPREKIAVASIKIDRDCCNKLRPCHSYFSFSSRTDFHTIQVRKSEKKSFIKKFFSFIISKTGICDFKTNYKVSCDFLSFYDDFNPDIVYSALGNIQIMLFFIQLMKLRKFRLVIHIWDDFLPRLDGRWFSTLWKDYSDGLFRKILKHNNLICLSIGEKMSEEYCLRYNHSFYPFHNPVDPEIWDISIPKMKHKTIIMSYFGKINTNTSQGIIDMCEVVEQLSNEGVDICFEIHSGNIRLNIAELISTYSHTKICPLLPREDIPTAFKSSDFLFYPISFDKRSINYQRLSIHTKLTEYLISNVPTIMYASKEIAAYQYMEKNDAAILCGINDIELLKQRLVYAINNMEYTKKISENAYKLAIEKHTVSEVRNKFLHTITMNM